MCFYEDTETFDYHIWVGSHLSSSGCLDKDVPLKMFKGYSQVHKNFIYMVMRLFWNSGCNIKKKTLAKTAKPFQGSKKLPCSKRVIKIQQIEATHRSHEHISLNVLSLICFLYHPVA